MQLRAWREGCSSVSGNEAVCLKVANLATNVLNNTSMLSRALSRARRTSAGEKREKTSSLDWGSS